MIGMFSKSTGDKSWVKARHHLQPPHCDRNGQFRQTTASLAQNPARNRAGGVVAATAGICTTDIGTGTVRLQVREVEEELPTH